MIERTSPQERLNPARYETVVAEGVSFENFLKIFADQHTEWLMGKVISIVSNNIQHNAILVLLTTLLNLFLSARSIGRLLSASVPMYISDQQPAREPDLLIILNEHVNRIQPTYLNGLADIVIEVISPESSIRDRGDKFDEYESAGVPEYWLLDPKRTEATIYVLGADGAYRPRPLDSEGRLTSSLLTGFALHPELLWRETPPSGTELNALVKQMIRL
jgi:Uma2 family endonuclease